MSLRVSLLTAVLLAGVPAFVHADDAPTTMPATEPTTQGAAIAASETDTIKGKMGETVTLEGEVESASWSKSGAVMNVMFKDAGDDGVMITIFKSSREKLDAAFDGDAAAKLAGAKVQVTGKVESYGGKKESWKGRPQIVVNAPEQIKITEAAAK